MSHERTIPKRKDCLPIIMFQRRAVCWFGLVDKLVRMPCWMLGIFQLLGWKLKFSITKYVIPETLNLFAPDLWKEIHLWYLWINVKYGRVSTFSGSTRAWGSTYHPPTPRKGHVERQLVVEQLRSGGVIEALQVQRAGFPCRCTVIHFCWGVLVAERWMDHTPKVKLKSGIQYTNFRHFLL